MIYGYKTYAEFLASDTWKEIREVKLKQSNYTCKRCGEKKYLQVHHLNYNHRQKILKEDLVVLCKKCHEKTHGK